MSVRPKHPNYRHVPSDYVRPDPRDSGLARNVAKGMQFLDLCSRAGVQPTIRQARAYLAGRGRWAKSHRVA